MPFSLTDLIYGFAAPVLLAGAVFYVLARVLPGELPKRFAATAALAGGFCLGYWLLGLGPWQPETHWHWLPYAVLATLAAGPAASVPGLSWLERTLLYALVAIIAGWLLVPDWDDLEPSRGIYLLVWIPYVALIMALLEGLLLEGLLLEGEARRSSGWLLPFGWTATLMTAAVILALSGSLRFAQMAGAGAGAALGIALVTGRMEHRDALRGGAPALVILVAGSLLVGRVNSFSDVPWASYLLVPLSPLLLWSGAVGPLARSAGWKRQLLPAALALVPLVLAVVLAVAADLAG